MRPDDTRCMLVCMRTTINLPDGLAEAAKARAAEQGTTFTNLVIDGLRRVLDDDPTGVDVPELPVRGDPEGRPLVDLSDRDAVAEALDADGLR